MPKLNRQQQIVYDYLLKNPGSTHRDITNATFIDARARMSEMRSKGIVFEEVGEVQYSPLSRPFKKYQIAQQQLPLAV